jgi:hypothetical protein
VRSTCSPVGSAQQYHGSDKCNPCGLRDIHGGGRRS